MAVPSPARRREALSGLTPLQGQAWSGLLRTYGRLVHDMAADLDSSSGIGLSAYDVLRTLALQPSGQLRLGELAEAVMLGRAGLSGLVGRLEVRGLVERVPSAEDRRGAYARLTDAGWRELRRAHRVHVASVQTRFAERLTPEQLAALVECWRALGTAP